MTDNSMCCWQNVAICQQFHAFTRKDNTLACMVNALQQHSQRKSRNKRKHLVLALPSFLLASRKFGARALQIAMGAPVLIAVTPGTVDPIEIATTEFDKQALPITVARGKISGTARLIYSPTERGGAK